MLFKYYIQIMCTANTIDLWLTKKYVHTVVVLYKMTAISHWIVIQTTKYNINNTSYVISIRAEYSTHLMMMNDLF